MLLSNYKAISFVLFAAGIILLAYAVFFAWKNRLSRMYRDVKNIESALPVEEAGREVFSAIRAEDLRRYQENSDTGATDTHPHRRAVRASERERTRDAAEPASSGFTVIQEGLPEDAEHSEEETSPFVSYAAEGEATSYMEETGEGTAAPAGEDEATSYMGGFSEEEATSYMEEADVPDEDEATSYMGDPEEPDENDATSFMEAPEENDATSYMDDPGESEAASFTDASVEEDAEEATSYMAEEPAEEEDISCEEKADVDESASEAGKEAPARESVSPHTSNAKELSSEPDPVEESEQETRADDPADDPDDSDATTFLADPASREYREDVMDAIYALEEDSDKGQKGKEENHSAKHKQKPSGSGKKTKKSKDTGEKKKPHAASKKNAGNSEGWFDLEDYL